MTFVTLALLVTAAPDTLLLEERIDLFDPSSGAYVGAERTWFGPDGRRLRWEITDAESSPTLLFFVTHDRAGRESGAFYIEAGADSPTREVFTYSPDGRVQTVIYYYEPGVPADRTEVGLDEHGRTLWKRFHRADGTRYGEEEWSWDEHGNELGWDFRYVDREGGASFRYDITELDEAGRWVRRTRSRDGVPERREVRSRFRATVGAQLPTSAPFAPGVVSGDRLETSPSFTRDGKTMVFARYGDDWNTKQPFIAHLGDDGWGVEALTEIGSVYNLAISPDGESLIYATAEGDARTLFRIRRTRDGWSDVENLTQRFGFAGAYACLTDQGDLIFFDANGPTGGGIYLAPRAGEGFGTPQALFIPTVGTAFDGFSDSGERLLFSHCKDDACASGPENGFWELELTGGQVGTLRKLPRLPYAWGGQPVNALGLFVFTDGDDILTIPLALAGSTR